MPPDSDQLWPQLVKSAVLGSERSAMPAVAEDPHSPLAKLLAQVTHENREAELLRIAAIISTHERCGLVMETAAEMSLPACEPDDLPRCSIGAAGYLRRMLAAEFPFLLSEFLGALQASGRRVPEELLPDLLDSAKRDTELRALTTAVIGRRGHWLAALNPDWSFMGAEITPADWETGTRASRTDLLRRLRRENPEQALNLLQSTWTADAPEDRIAFIAELGQGLSRRDESFLETALDDRRKEVRQQAADLLMRMPESTLVQRVWQRLSPLVRLEKPSRLKLKKLLGKSTVEVDLPDRWDSMQHDGIEEKPPAGMGEKAWWLLQMARAIPPERWENHLQLSAEKCVAAFAGSEFASSLLPGISGAVHRRKDSRWARPMVEVAVSRIMDGGRAASKAWNEWSPLLNLVAVLEEGERDSLIAKHFSQRGMEADAVLGKLLQSCPGPWSRKLAKGLLDLLRNLTKEMAAALPHLWSSLGDLTVLAGRMPVSIADEAQQGWPDDALGKPFFKPMQTITGILQFRSKMLKEIN